jgi:crossover junction endodeoxyribonuclease RuvC
VKPPDDSCRTILGVDPGLRFSGFSVFKRNNSKVFLLDCGCLQLKQSESLSERVKTFYDFFSQKVLDFLVSEVSLETPFLFKNAQTFLKLGYLRGILYLIASQKNLKVHEFAPREVKLAVTGFGGAKKEQVANVVQRMFPREIESSIKHARNDVTDALSIGLCGLWLK